MSPFHVDGIERLNIGKIMAFKAKSPIFLIVNLHVCSVSFRFFGWPAASPACLQANVRPTSAAETLLPTECWLRIPRDFWVKMMQNAIVELIEEDLFSHSEDFKIQDIKNTKEIVGDCFSEQQRKKYFFFNSSEIVQPGSSGHCVAGGAQPGDMCDSTCSCPAG